MSVYIDITRLGACTVVCRCHILFSGGRFCCCFAVYRNADSEPQRHISYGKSHSSNVAVCFSQSSDSWGN